MDPLMFSTRQIGTVHRIISVLFAVFIMDCTCCSPSASNRSPVDVLSQFLEVMERSNNDINALQDVYELLDSKARKALKARAHKAETLAGRTFHPWEMLAHGRFRLRFLPVQGGGMQAKINGNRAVVIVTGSENGYRAEVPMVREKEGWKVELVIPAL